MNVQSMQMTMQVNGETVQLHATPAMRLSQLLRNELGLRGTKSGCDAGDCGACTVLLDGAPICACLTPAIQATGRKITTIETRSEPELVRLQSSFLRHGAAQCGICTPGMLMAAMALLKDKPTPERQEVEDALGGVLCRCTGYSKIIDAVCNAHQDTQPAASPAAGQAVGHRVERLDGVAKVAGTELFGADSWPDGALLVRVIRAPHDRARFEFGDLEAWRNKHPGVAVVLTADDIPGDNRFGVIPTFAEQPALASGESRFTGEAVALIAGEEQQIADMDLSDFPVVWEPLDALSDPLDALEADAFDVHADRKGNILIQGKVVCGDVEAALGDASHIVEAQMQTGYVEHAYIEPEAGCAWLDGDTLVIRACTQAPHMDRDDTARILDMPPEKIRIIPAAAGGGFGSKLDVSLQPLVGLVTLKTGRPARMVYSRHESMLSTTKRHPSLMKAALGADALGKVVAMRFHGEFNTGAYASWGPTVAVRVPVHASGPYAVANYAATANAVHTNGPVSGAFRGFGVPQAALLQETLYEDLAYKSGIDRLDLRRINAMKDGDTSVCGQHMQGVGIAECLDALVPHWHEALEDCARFNAGSQVLKRGVGIASCWYGCGNTGLSNPSTIRLGITADGHLMLHQGATDIGQGSNTVIAQICADSLGLPLSEFELIGPDTALTPDCGKTSASRQTFVTGKAAQKAGLALREKILRQSNMGSEAVLALDAHNNCVTVTDGKEVATLSLAALPVDTNGYVLSAEETYDPPTTALDENGQGVPYAVYGYGAQIAIVEVDTALGRVYVKQIIAAHDLGRVINPLLAEGQVEGGIAQGLGMALMEEYIPGRTANLHDYLIPTMGDMPSIKTIFVEKTDPEGPVGAKGLGEHVLIPTAPAILNAIRHACGARITRLPALPHRVLAAISAHRQDMQEASQ